MDISNRENVKNKIKTNIFDLMDTMNDKTRDTEEKKTKKKHANRQKKYSWNKHFGGASDDEDKIEKV